MWNPNNYSDDRFEVLAEDNDNIVLLWDGSVDGQNRTVRLRLDEDEAQQLSDEIDGLLDNNE